ncbi:Laminin subunit gamma-1 [Chionoecetes opilio]|uniref:Laminin subunit gamma-1 n=1 Tax=Chionoecetes opilio TaxID=41210 RepID=A0A8J4XWG8_CHIOP|nr:Laminin subunit gamma-1 [Chionoecetes opilio]
MVFDKQNQNGTPESVPMLAETVQAVYRCTRAPSWLRAALRTRFKAFCSTALSREAERIKAEAEELMAGRQDLVQDVQSQLVETMQLVQRGRAQQQVTSELLADTFTAEGQAKEAINTAEHTLSEAKETLTILEGFDKQVQESREEAKDALGRVGEIEQLIREAEDRTDEAEAALTGAEEDAKSARDIAKDAQDTADEASEQAGQVRRKADVTKEEASSLKDRADLLASQVAGTEARVATYEVQVEADQEQVLEAQEKANQAKGKADEASARVHEAYETVQEILDLLERSTDLDPAQLDALDRRLQEAWQTYYQSGIETTVSEFSEALNWQQRQISLYEEEIRRLQIEVRNIEEIKISLPVGCYSQTKLEP